MLELGRILVATDFSPGSHLALQHAIDLASATHAEMHIVFAEVLHGDPYDEGVRTRLHHLVEEQLKLRNSTGLQINYAIERDFAAAPAILRYADDKGVDLVVMGTHGRRGLRRLMLGSVAQEVVRLAPCPVLTVRGYDEKESTIKPIRSILVPVDFSEYSKSALAVARELAACFGARMDVFHIVEDTFHPAFYGPFFQSVYDVEPRIEEKSREHLNAVIEEVSGPEVQYTVDSFKGYAPRDISQYAEEKDSDLIVMSTHGLRGVEHFFLGSVTERTVRIAPCPVWTTKPAASGSGPGHLGDGA